MFRIFFVFMLYFLFVGCSINNVKDSEEESSENTVKSIPITVLNASSHEKRRINKNQ